MVLHFFFFTSTWLGLGLRQSSLVVEDIYFSFYRQYAAYIIISCNPTNIFLIMNTNNAKQYNEY